MAASLGRQARRAARRRVRRRCRPRRSSSVSGSNRARSRCWGRCSSAPFRCCWLARRAVCAGAPVAARPEWRHRELSRRRLQPVARSSSARDELGALVEAHNELGSALREQRQQLVQRELMLDTVTQNSPVALLLVDARERVVLFESRRAASAERRPQPSGPGIRRGTRALPRSAARGGARHRRPRCSRSRSPATRRCSISPSAASACAGGRIACCCSNT